MSAKKPWLHPLFLFSLCLSAIALGLAGWQWQRGEWKQELLQTMAAQWQGPSKAVLPLPVIRQTDDLSALSGEEASLRLLQPFNQQTYQLSGHFLAFPLLRRLSYDQKMGSVNHWLLPFMLTDGHIMAISIGIAPVTIDADFIVQNCLPKRKSDIQIMLRLPPESSQRYSILQPHQSGYLVANWQLSSYKALGLQKILPVWGMLMQQHISENSKFCPQGYEYQDILAAIPNNHQQYMMTWLALAVILPIMGYLFARDKRTQNKKTNLHL